MTGKKVLKGTYCILIYLDEDSRINIGKLGEVDFPKGYYVYVGSALNSLEARVKRHLSSNKKLHWHIDYFLISENTEIVEVLYTINDDRWECHLAQEIAKNSTGISRFGCSDCKCDSHLLYFKNFGDLESYCYNAFDVLNLIPEKYEPV